MWRIVVFCFLLSALEAFELSTSTFEGATFTVCRVDLRKDALALFLTAPDGRLCGNFDRLANALKAEGGTLEFAMNAGMFEPNHTPVGLFIADGKERSPLNLKEGQGNFFLKPNGVFAIAGEKFVILRSEAWHTVAGPVRLATQSGPLLVENGVIHPAFSPGSKSVFVRNAVGVSSPAEACFVISDRPVNFHLLARFLKEGLGCPDALYLDGTVSSIYSPALHRNDARYNLGPIIGVITAPRQKPPGDVGRFAE